MDTRSGPSDGAAGGAQDPTAARAAAAYKALFDQAPVAIIAVSTDRTIHLNRAALELFGRSQDEMSAWAFKPGAPWIPAEQAERWEDMRRRIAAGEAISAFRFKLVRPGGERRDAEAAAIPMTEPDGSPGGVITVIVDQTEQVSLETQLRHSQKMEALGRLAGGIAHDFNNVLMGILGYADFVLEDARKGAVEVGDAEQVVAATRRAIDLAGRLTAFARRDTSRAEIVDVGQAIEDMVPLLRRLAPETIEIQANLAPDLFVLVDRSDLEQSLMNLAVNSIDAMPGGGRLAIDVEGVDLDDEYMATHLGSKPGPHAMVSISDTGSGMDETTRTRMFEPFFTTKPVGEGTGLGLAMVFGAVERAGGRIWVYSEPGRGTTFKIYLPLGDGRRGAEPSAGDELMPGGTESILVLEDDELVREVVDRTLRRLGYAVTVAGLPEDAIQLAAQKRFDALVTDVVMPGLTGDEVARRIRDSQPDLPVVFMSGYTATVLDLELRQRDAFTPKPVSAGRLARAVRDVLDRARSGGAT
jgi:two-component system, cell cycle sensor histidine kinase and response regulator CckA